MAVRCLTATRFTMEAELLRQIVKNTSSNSPVGDPPGTWVGYQNPITGSILNEWVPGSSVDNPATVVNETTTPVTISCLARGIVDGGIRVAGTTERFGDVYENIDFVKMWVPARVRISKRDRITNIRAKKGGAVVWIDEEFEGRPTIFNVNGVTPLFDAFNNHTESFVLLERAEDA